MRALLAISVVTTAGCIDITSGSFESHGDRPDAGAPVVPAPDASTGPASADAARPPTGPDAAPGTPQASLGAHARIVFLHHSTGGVIWDGGVAAWVTSYNQAHQTAYAITERAYPSGSPYPWENYPYDYWNIWVSHAGPAAYMTEPTLEMLTADYDLIVFKHCFPVSSVEADTGSPDVTSSVKSLENYELQYQALKAKMHEFPRKRFIVWTGSALREADTDPAQAARANAFADWVKNTWDEPGDNIFVWDFRQLETQGGLYLRPEYSAGDSHPNATLAAIAAPLFGQRMADVIEGYGDLR